jgi:hypothetical protein
MTGIVGLTISCMKGQGIYTKFKVKYSKKEALRSITPWERKLQPSWWILRKRKRRRYG